MSKKIAVIGSSSMVGSRFCELSQNLSLVKADLNGETKIDITDKTSVDDFFAKNEFEWLILFSAFTDVDRAQEQNNDKDASCWKINVDGVQNIADACSLNSKKIILISTDFVFDGKSGPYKEEPSQNQDESLIGWYGKTKQKSEQIVTSQLKDNIILRISYPYRAKFDLKTDFARNILEKYKANDLYPLFNDQQITPTFADDIAPAISLLLENDQRGFFHIASPVLTSPFEFGKKLIETFDGDVNKVKEGSLTAFLKNQNATPRPINGGLEVGKLTALGFKPTEYTEGIRKIYSQIKDH